MDDLTSRLPGFRVFAVSRFRDSSAERRPLLIVVFLLSLLIRCGVLLLMPDALVHDPDGYRRLAENVVEHGTFGAAATPTAFRPPLYPLVLTGCVVLGDYGRLAIGALHALLGVGTVGLVLALGRLWGLSRGVAALAALLVACDPILLSQSAQVMTETLATFLAVAGLVTLTWASRHPAVIRSALAGATLALAVLCRPTLLVWLLAAGAVIACRRYLPTPMGTRGDQSAIGVASYGRVRYFAAFVVAAALVLAPWAIRNQLQFGRPIVTTTHGGYTLLLANNGEFYQWLRTGQWDTVWQADRFNADWDRRKPQDERTADRLAYSEAWQNIRREPGMFLYASLVRVGRLWSPLPHRVVADETRLRCMARYVVALWYVAVFALAAVFCWGSLTNASRRCPEQGRRAVPVGQAVPDAIAAVGQAVPDSQTQPDLRFTWLWGMLLVGSLTAVHAVYWTDMRMRAPAMPVVALAAAAGCFRGKVVGTLPVP